MVIATYAVEHANADGANPSTWADIDRTSVV